MESSFDNTSAVTAVDSTFAIYRSSPAKQAVSKELTATVGMIVSAIAVIANAVVLVVTDNDIYFPSRSSFFLILFLLFRLFSFSTSCFSYSFITFPLFHSPVFFVLSPFFFLIFIYFCIFRLRYYFRLLTL